MTADRNGRRQGQPRKNQLLASRQALDAFQTKFEDGTGNGLVDKAGTAETQIDQTCKARAGN